jgi:hypothetical protein
MSPTFFAKVASRLFEHRWWLLAMSALGIAAAFSTFSLGSPGAAVVVGTLAGPFIAVPWGLLCACIWFHPQRGNLQPNSKLVGKLPPVLQSGVRWYAALFLSFFLVVSALVWPALSLAWL